MAVWDNGAFTGFVSGGCTEAAVAAEAVLAIEKGNDRFLRLGEGSLFFDIVLPCGGGITLAIHVLRDAEIIRDALAALERRSRIAVSYNPSRQRMTLTSHDRRTGWTDDCFIRAYRPKPRLHLCGRGIELETTQRLASAAEYDTVVHDHDRGFQTHLGALDEDSAVALLYHDIDHELPILEQALKGKPFYIGALGSTRTHQRRCEALWLRGVSQTETQRIVAPIGMIRKARDARTLAISVVSEIAAVRAGLST